MDQVRSRLMRDLATILAIYLIALASLLRWHWLQGPLHTQATLGLLVAFGLCAALVGLSSVSVALAALHWTRRVSGLIVGLAVLGLFWAPLFAWNEFLLWQLIVMLTVQTGCLVLALGTASSMGWMLVRLEAADREESKPGPSRAFQLSITDFLGFAGALALLCAVMRGSRAVDLGVVGYSLNAAGGGCAAVVVLTVLWACFGQSSAIPRAAALVFVAPTGGAVYVVAARYAPLLFNAPWYSGVTTALVLFMAIPCLVMRSRGYRFAKGGWSPHGRQV